MIYYDILWYIMIFMNYESCWKNMDYHYPWTWNPVLIQLENMLRSFHGLGPVIVSAVEAAVCCTPYRFAKFGGKQFRLFFFWVDSGFGIFLNFRSLHTSQTRVIKRLIGFVADWYGIRVLVAFIGLAYTCMSQNREPRKPRNARRHHRLEYSLISRISWTMLHWWLSQWPLIRGFHIASDGTGWGPQDSVQLPYFSGFMVDITIVFIGLISWFINPQTSLGGPILYW